LDKVELLFQSSDFVALPQDAFVKIGGVACCSAG
jgi:hypothetical protein